MWYKIKFFGYSALVFILMGSFALSCPISEDEKKTGARCINVGGDELYIKQFGNKSAPAIVFEPGLGDNSTIWEKIIVPLSQFANIVVYDRKGLGKSQSNSKNNQPRTAQQVVQDLKMLLENAEISPPYILIGHSIGGIYMQLFTQQHPNQVAGILLIDSASREQKGDEPLPPTDAFYYLEAKGIKESLQQVRDAPLFPGNIPMIVIATKQKGSDWIKIQKNLAKLSKNSEFVTTKNSGHYIHLEEPYLIVHAIKQMLMDIELQRGQK